MTVKLVYFAWVREKVGRAEETVALPGGIARWLSSLPGSRRAAQSTRRPSLAPMWFAPPSTMPT